MKMKNIELTNLTIVEYIFSPDSFAANGIQALLHNIGKDSIIVSGGLLDFNKIYSGCFQYRLSVIFPEEPHDILFLIRNLAHFIRSFIEPICIIILTTVPPEWLLLSLSSLGCPSGMLINIHILPSRICFTELIKFFSSDSSFYRVSYNSERRHSLPEVLTAGEFQVVSDWLAGHHIPACAISAQKSVKTLYSQRKSGLRKLSAIFPILKPRNIKSED